MDPKIIFLPEIRIVGMKYRGRNEHEEIPRLWREFWPRHKEIEGQKETVAAYGVITNFDSDNGEFDYCAGLEVSEEKAVPRDMVFITVPPQTYAIFDCTLPTLMETMEYIHNDWLPESQYRRSDGPEFEFYDERFDVDQNRYEMSVYIPIEGKSQAA
jgi:AraC family transcriptional regulator